MVNYIKMADLFVEYIKKEYSDDIAIVAYYGSYAQGTQNQKSDLDLFFIPATERGRELSDCIILDGIGIDFFSIPWKRAERIANFEENIVSVIADCKPLYVRSKEDQKRFESLQETIKSYQKPEKRKDMLDKASSQFESVYRSLYLLRRSEDSSEQRTEVFHTLSTILQSIMLINQTYSKSGWGKNFEQIFSLSIQPLELKELVYKVINDRSRKEVLEVLETLCDRTAKLLKQEKDKLRSKNSFKEVFEKFYEELSSTFLKIITACDNKQPEIAFCACAMMQDEVNWCLYLIGDPTIEKIFSAIEPLRVYNSSNLEILKNAALNYEWELVRLLDNNDVHITRLDNLEEYRNYLIQKRSGGKHE